MKKNIYAIIYSAVFITAMVSCGKESLTGSITVQPPTGQVVKAGFNVEKITNYAPVKLQMVNTSQNADSYIWSIDANDQTSTVVSPAFMISRKGTYNIKLIAVKGTVKDSVTKQVVVENDPAMIGMYLFSRNWNDSSNYNNSINSGNGLLAYEADRKNNSAAAINLGNLGGALFLPNNLLKNTGTATTVSLWFKTSNLIRNPLLGLWEDVAYATVNTPSVYLDVNGKLQIKLPTGTVAPQITVEGVTANTWNHLVIAGSGPVQKAYLNGVLAGSVNDVNINYGNMNMAALGHMYTPANSTWAGLPGATWSATNYKGYMDDVRIYNRMLTDTEVRALYEE